MRALITGIGGFVGKHLANFLLSQNYEVYGITKDEVEIKNTKIFKVDITNEVEMDHVIKEVLPEVIFHLAAISSVSDCDINIDLTHKVNVEGTNNLLSACIKNNIKPVTLITSTAHVYGMPKYIPLDENHPINPQSAYAKSKLLQEGVALDFFKKHNLPIIITRGFNQIGPEQRTGFVCSDFAKQIAKIEKDIPEPEIVVGDLSPIRDFSDVRDIVKLYYLLSKRGSAGEVYNVGNGVGYPIKEILNKLVSMSKVKITVVESKDLTRKSDLPVLVANVEKIRKIISLEVNFKIDDSLNDILTYWRTELQ